MGKRKILLVDDEKGFTDVLQLNLESTGNYLVRVENNPSEAVRAALKFLPDLVLLDIIMPSMEGPDIAIEMKRTPSLEKVPIVFLTATVTQAEVDSQDGQIGGHPFVAKPSDFDSLVMSIERALAAA